MNVLFKIYEKLSYDRQQIVEPFWISDDEYAKLWIEKKLEEKECEEKIKYRIDEEQSFLTERGEVVRSKSEKILADKFYKLEIPYVYEAPVRLKNYGRVYPDFLLLNKKTRKEYYWEHLGMMDIPEYSNKAIKKIETFHNSGIFTGESLILSYETHEHFLNMKEVQRLIDKYFT